MKKNTVSLCLFGGALIGGGLSNSAAADVSVDGTLHSISIDYVYDLGSYSATAGSVNTDSWTFEVLADGNVQIDMLAVEIGTDWIDPDIFLFSGGGAPSLGNLIAYNDDIDYGVSDFNGSVSGYDSFMDLFLNAGVYTVVIGSYDTSAAEAVAGVTAYGFLFSTVNSSPSFGNYHMDIYGNVALVPAPSAVALLGLGGLIGSRRRR